MKVKKKQFLIASYIGLCAASYMIIMFMLVSIFGVQRYTASVDCHIVSGLQDELVALVATLPCGLLVSPAVSAKKIQEQFPWVKSVSFSRIPTNAMQVRVQAEEPQVRINEMVITQGLRLLSAATFVPESVSHIPTLQVAFADRGGRQIPLAFIPHAHTFTDERFSPYTITWIDEYSARLTDKEQPNFTILFNASAIPDAAMFAHCVTIKKQLEERGSFTGRKGTRWVADVRFDHQVIVFSEDRGISHG